MKSRISAARATVLTLLCLAVPAAALAADADYPAKPVRLIVPFAAGGATDIFGRLVANELSQSLHQPFVVENRPGGGGNIGSNVVASAAPDGYTLLLGAAGNIAINPGLFKNMPFDPIKDLSPVALAGSSINVLVVPASLPAASVQDLIALAKSKPGALNYASSGNGGTTHLAAEMFKTMADVDILHVPYQGSGPAMIDLLAARVDLMFDNLPSALPKVQSGELKALGVTGSARSQSMPDVPTVAEAGVPGFEATTWFGIFAPAGTPQPIVDKLNAAVNAALDKPEIIARLDSMGAEAKPTTPAAFAELVATDTRKWGEVIRQANISID
ncbi:tripartite tricarboxylate transporter substrate binding protein [Verticiella sediminum]|uniref:Tripartite tricarboxylate transporter substrate binding protein n=1 Tax=Verticiella sediminum TaxID=1247510 RepID=A0A556AIG3_9BURK|nr:tripartite tricarboxylate transporter substrate binding protein [Verticiella sediminum]TSH92667.1 tripartite tricarboxylate transporter substrate binding protein [Verticiella sediminum]